VSVPFPTLVGDSVPLALGGLPDYVRNFNKTSAPSKLNIWVPTRAEMGKLQDPVTVRLVLPDILVAYCVLSAPTSRNGLSVETVTVSGPREQVLKICPCGVLRALIVSFPRSNPTLSQNTLCIKRCPNRLSGWFRLIHRPHSNN